ncbi:MAG: alpha/beta hydrolase [Anaerolineales bacterium]|nr:alpha/beta hydrolase [Anaerolineales bacterium]
MDGAALSYFTHVHVDNGRTRTLFLLHGTGGNERDLLPLVEPLAEQYNLVGLRGNVQEGGMPRFFARQAMGVFDQESIRVETEKLAAFLAAWNEKHGLNPEQAAFAGYSNGANMLLAALLRYPNLLRRAALLHCMLPFDPPQVDLSGGHYLVTHGLQDSMMPPGAAAAVIAALGAAGATVQEFSHPGGHELTHAEREALLNFLNAT